MDKQTLERTTQLANDYADSRSRYRKAMRDVINKYDSMSFDDDYWSMVEHIAERLSNSHGPTYPVKHAVDSLFWGILYPVKYAVDSLFWGILAAGNFEIEAWEKCTRFYMAYRAMVKTLHTTCYEFDAIDKSDDSYGDFMDSLPLAGREVIEQLLVHKSITHGDNLIGEVQAARPKLAEFIVDGENYIAMTMESRLLHYFPAVVRRSLDDNKGSWASECGDDDTLASRFFEQAARLDAVTDEVDRIVEAIIGDDYIGCGYDHDEHKLIVTCSRMPEEAEAVELIIEKRTGFEDIFFMVGGA